MPSRVLLAALCLAALLAPVAHAFQVPAVLAPVQGNPAEALATLPPDPVAYDDARRCLPAARPGVARFTAWLQRNVRGAFWGSYRCERWGRGSASLHAENRAVDWHLDAADPADRRAAATLITLLLAPDRAGTPQALARRMGVQEIIWDCAYWGAGMTGFKPYSPCFGKDGTPRGRVNVTLAHRDHMHLGLSRDGAGARTSFWRGR